LRRRGQQAQRSDLRGRGRGLQQAQRLEFEIERKGSIASPQTRISEGEEEVHRKLRDSNLRTRGRGPQQAQRFKFKRERKGATASSET
jgi:hypothetical protein